MEFIVIVLLGIIIFLIINNFNSNNNRVIELQHAIYDLKSQISKLEKKILESLNSKPVEPITNAQEVNQSSFITPKDAVQATPEPVKPTEIIPETPLESVIQPTEPEIHAINATVINDIIKSEKPVEKPILEHIDFGKPDSKFVFPEPSVSWFKKFLDNNPDLEKFIGENLINKIGIAILVFGIGFFVKFAIDKNWINEIGRVCIGLLCGFTLIGIAQKLKNNYREFSSILVGGGLAVLYFTIALAFHQYHLFSQTAAFVAMLGVTLIAVVFNIAYDRIELAVIALLGGLSTPFMVSTGDGNYHVLFTYLLILNAGMLYLAYYKKWRLVNLISYVCTIIIFSTWYMTKGKPDTVAHLALHTLLYAGAFYILFFAMNIIYNLKNGTKILPLEISIIFSNALWFYSVGMNVLSITQHNNMQGLFTAALAIVNFVFAFALYKSKKIDKNIVYLLIGLLITFLSLIAPIQLQGHYITMFWAIECVVLLWYSQQSKLRLVQISSIVILFCLIISLILDWQKYVRIESHYAILLNPIFITGIVSLIALWAYNWLLQKEENEYFIVADLSLSFMKIVLKTLFTVVLYGVLVFELRYQIVRIFHNNHILGMYFGVYNLVFISTLIYLFRNKIAEQKIYVLALPVLALVVFWLSTYSAFVFYRNEIITNNYPFDFHVFTFFIAIALLTFIYIASYKWCKIIFGETSQHFTILKFVYAFFTLLTASVVLNYISVILFRNYGIGIVLQQTQKFGYAVLWGVIAFVYMIIGMQKKDSITRIIALSILLITLLKLFILDIQGINEVGKIIAFILLGVLLLVMSFMYQKIKKIVFDDDSKSNKIEN